MITIAIDPGIHGAVAYYAPDLGYLKTEALPTTWRMVNKKKRHTVDVRALYELLEPWTGRARWVIEEPHGMPGAGAVSQFNFGATCGALWALLELLARPGHVIKLNPSVWKRAMQCPSDKNRTRAMAKGLFPEYQEQFARPSDEGRADAALMAYYVAHRYGKSAQQGGV